MHTGHICEVDTKMPPTATSTIVTTYLNVYTCSMWSYLAVCIIPGGYMCPHFFCQGVELR